RMQRMASHLVHLISSIKNILLQSVDAIQYFPQDELKLVTEAFNATTLWYDKQKTISELVEMQANKYPTAVAVCCEERILTYAALNAEANRMAHHLRNHFHIQPGDRVGLIMDRTERMTIALLAILKSGAAYVPIDPAYPQERCRYMQEDSGMRLLIVEKEYGTWSNTKLLNWESGQWNDEPSDNIPQLHSADSLVYIIYTSGSTGQPKGVAITHRALHNLCAWHVQAFGVDAGSRGTLYAGIGFDAAAWELWPYLVSGASVYPIPDALRFNLQSLADHLNKNAITHCFLPTPACEEIIRNKIAVSPTMYLLTGGDRLRVLPTEPMNLYNNYGPTESTVVATSMPVPAHGTTIPIGKPIGNTKIHILDSHLQPVPIGIYGEMYLSGDGLALGYYNKEALTSERFLQHPLTGERMFRTGDFGRWLADGSIDFLGRTDNQVKLRGYRVEIGEVEHAIAHVTGVKNARVVADKTGAEVRLLGFYEGSICITDLQSALQATLPSYMIPSLCMNVEKFPLTPNGKIDDKELLRIAATSSQQIHEQDILTDNERKLAVIWEQVIGLPVLQRHICFFEAGGHSIKAMQLIHRVEKQLGLHISLRDIYNHPTLSAMAALMEKERSSGLSILLNHADAALPALYMIPPIVGSATIYSGIAQQLSDSFKCIGLQYPGFDDEHPFAKSIEATAQEFYNEVIQSQDTAITLLGYSLGALVAYETARLLESSGKQLTLVLLDREPAKEYDGSIMISAEMLAVIAKNEIDNVPETGIELSVRMKELIYQNIRNLHAYKQAGNVAANILAFNAADGNQQMQGWEKFTTGTVTCHTLAGNHYNLLSSPLLITSIKKYKPTIDERR
ncbi:MAG: amino acid adenylation domain-containing protein, partial [Chitinophagaceae bacterium]